MDLFLLQHTWYVVFLVAIFVYSALDGFDIGVGCLHPFARTEQERRHRMNAIGPFWDSNSLWIVMILGILFAGFPDAFAALLSTLYLPVTALIFGFFLRTVSVEARGKIDVPLWKKIWDMFFSFSSYLLCFGFGYIIAHLIVGLPLDGEGNRCGTLMSPFSPISLSTIALITSAFMLHGASFLNIKLEGNEQRRAQKTIFLLTFVTLISLCLFLDALFHDSTLHFCQNLSSSKGVLFLINLPALVALILMPSMRRSKKEFFPILASTLFLATLVINYAFGTFPYVVPSSVEAQEHSLRITNCSASSLALTILFFVALFGVPMFLSYSAYLFYTFRGKVRLEDTSY